MDQELKAYLEEQEARMSERFAQMDGRFTQMDERFTQMDERFTQMDERFAQMQAQMDGRFTRMEERFAQMQVHVDERFKQVEADGRHTRILVEGLHDNVRLIAEAVVGTNERIDTLRVETTARLDEIKGSVALIQQGLVPRVQNLEHRMLNHENRAERQTRDVLEVIRERFGLRKAP